MNLLMLTRKVDRGDSNAGFIFWFAAEIGRQLKKRDNKAKLYVICLNKGNISGLPANIEVYSMGKEKGVGKLARIMKGEWLMLKLIGKIDGVFTHMMPEYASLAGVWCKLFKKKLVHWYMHKAVNENLVRAERWVDEFVTATPLSFRMKTKKSVNYVGHIIDVDKFNIKILKHENTRLPKPGTGGQVKTKIKILSVSRISPSKDIETLIEAIELLTPNFLTETPTGRKKEIKKLRNKETEIRNNNLNALEVQIVGGPGLPDQKDYFESLKCMVKQKGLERIVNFLGPVTYSELPKYYQQADIFINTSHTGSLDKTVLEAMASGCLPLTCNEAFDYMLAKKDLMFKKGDVQDLAHKVMDLVKMSTDKKEKLKQGLRQEVVENHSLCKTVEKILNLYRK